MTYTREELIGKYYRFGTDYFSIHDCKDKERIRVVYLGRVNGIIYEGPEMSNNLILSEFLKSLEGDINYTNRILLDTNPLESFSKEPDYEIY